MKHRINLLAFPLQRQFMFAYLRPVGFVLVAILIFVLSAGPVEAAEPLDGFTVAPGLQATVYAGADQMANPVSIDVDDRGRVWVLETVNYRKDTRATGDRVLILEDTNGNGRIDSQKLFYEGKDINGGHGICVLGNRVIVSVSDRIVMLTDTDGDDKSDSNMLLFKGSKVNDSRGVLGQHDHTLHAVQFGPDGRLYFNFGNFTPTLFAADGKAIVDIHGNPVANTKQPYLDGMALRCELDGSNVEVVGHNFRNNWEVTADSFGSMWQSDNDAGSRSCRVNYVMEFGNHGYRDEVTGLGWTSPRTGMSSDHRRKMWHQNDPGVVPNLLITGYGAPSGMQVYEGELLPAQYRNQMLLAEPARNVLWSIPVSSSGAGYTAKVVDILRSPTDKAFRPCDISVAPDGSLFVADWFDPIVCCHANKDDRGRIFRVAPPGHKYAPPVFDYTTAKGAMTAMRSPNLSARFQAWTTLTAMGASARPEVKQAVTDPNPRVRARALWLLAAIDGDPAAAAKQAMADEDENVRAMTLRIVRRHKQDTSSYVQQLMTDKSPVVRRECAIALCHQAPTAKKAAQWAVLAVQHDGKDPWYLEALGIGSRGHEDACFASWKKKAGTSWRTAGGRDIVWRSRAAAAVRMRVQLLSDKAVPASEHPRLMRAFDFHDKAVTKPALFGYVKKGATATSAIAYLEAIQRLPVPLVKGNPTVMKELAAVLPRCTDNVLAVKLVRRYGLQRAFTAKFVEVAVAAPSSRAGIDAIKQVLATNGKAAIIATAVDPERITVLDALGYAGTPPATALLSTLILDKSKSTSLRRRAIHGLPKSNRGILILLGHLKKKTLPSALANEGTKLLLVSSNDKARSWARKELGIDGKNGADPLARLPKLLELTGHRQRDGQGSFTKAGCIACHKLGALGIDFGPDLSTIGSLMGETELFSAILAPSLSIKFGFEGETFMLNDGTTLVGFVSGENDTTVSLKLPGGIQRDLAKSEIKSRKQMEQSLMPAGLDAALTDQEMANLVAWLTIQRAK